eukprot:2395446-Pleurochrysis_carterae.AAC.1
MKGMSPCDSLMQHCVCAERFGRSGENVIGGLHWNWTGRVHTAGAEGGRQPNTKTTGKSRELRPRHGQ